MNKGGLKFQCQNCDVTFSSKSNFSKHVRNLHPNNKIEPVIVLNKSNDLSNKNQNTDPKARKVPENQNSSINPSTILPKPEKGMWLVKLERLK